MDYLDTVHVYLQTVVNTKMYSPDGDDNAAWALHALDGDVAMRIYEMYREHLPVISDIPLSFMEREIQMLEKTRQSTRQSDLDLEDMVAGLDLNASFY